ncbi:MAG: UDP-N-acetylglucosamine 2-epimerase (hydrolyzing) [Phycisphaerales bacterium]|nr:UDP-N-acetylglucosamine 2-epimerase (hydrolyzing) [Phycisphaerales bacterium]
MRTRRVMVVTGTRAEFGLLRPVMYAVNDRPELELRVVAAGSHLVQPAVTFREVKAEFGIADSIPMQTAGKIGRHEDVESLGKGIARFGRSLALNEPDWVVVLGDRIEAFAAACAASIGGYALAHIHGGDRAEGVADEAMRHAITKLAHLHFPATETSAERIKRMGEDPERVQVVGSPAADGLTHIERAGPAFLSELGNPECLVMMHPIGRDDGVEQAAMNAVLEGVADKRTLVMHPNLDPGRRGIVRAIEEHADRVVVREHLPRDQFVGVLKHLAASNGVVVGNSSAGLIECAIIGCPSVDVGNRQSGRERCDGWTLHADENSAAIRDAVSRVLVIPERGDHPYGDGKTGVRIAEILASTDPHAPGFVRKQCTY